ncbi:MAG: hypothetical protein AMXMBFR58_35740 [Phycisphaerae bacterium]
MGPGNRNPAMPASMSSCVCASVLLTTLFSPGCAGAGGSNSQPVERAAPQPAAAGAPQATAAPFKVVHELDKTILHVFQDSRGTYWFGSQSNGFYRWRGHGNTFDHFTTESGLRDNDVSRFQEDRYGNLYINTGQGISKFDGRAITNLSLDESQPVVTEWKLGPDDLWFRFGGDDPHAIFYDGTSLRKLRVPRTAEGDAFEAKLPRSKYPNRTYSPYDGYSIYKDSRGNVWFGTASLGACRFDGKNFAWISEQELGFDEKDNRTFGTRSMIEDRDGKFWITVTRYQFDMYPADAEAATRSTGGLVYTKSPGLAHAQQGVDEDYTYIMSMARDKAGDTWMATYGAGVWRHDGTKLTHYPVMVDGNPITVFSVYCDREGALWLGTHEHGVCKFNGTAFEKVKF